MPLKVSTGPFANLSIIYNVKIKLQNARMTEKITKNMKTAYFYVLPKNIFFLKFSGLKMYVFVVVVK